MLRASFAGYACPSSTWHPLAARRFIVGSSYVDATISDAKLTLFNYDLQNTGDILLKFENNVAKIIPTISASTHNVIATPQAVLELTFCPALANPFALNHRP